MPAPTPQGRAQLEAIIHWLTDPLQSQNTAAKMRQILLAIVRSSLNRHDDLLNLQPGGDDGSQQLNIPLYDPAKNYDAGDLVRYGTPEKYYVARQAGLLPAPTGGSDAFWQLVANPLTAGPLTAVYSPAQYQAAVVDEALPFPRLAIVTYRLQFDSETNQYVQLPDVRFWTISNTQAQYETAYQIATVSDGMGGALETATLGTYDPATDTFTEGGGDAIPLSGTKPGQPVTGLVEFADGVGFRYYDSANNYYIDFVSGDGLAILISDATTGQALAQHYFNTTGLDLSAGARLALLGPGGVGLASLTASPDGELLVNGVPVGGAAKDIYGYSQAKRTQVAALFTSPSQFKAADVPLVVNGVLDTSTFIGSEIHDLTTGIFFKLVPDKDNPMPDPNNPGATIATPTWIRIALP